MLAVEQFDFENIFSKLIGLRRVALAVSGGSDSMAMLCMVRQWAMNQPDPPQISVLTVNHGLRSEAAAEAEYVAQVCAGCGILHQTLRWLHAGVKTGIQAKARVARYDLMAAWCRDNGVSILLTAHTADDQAETVSMRLNRTDSPSSLAGIWPELPWKGVLIMRPLLHSRRVALQKYLTALGQDWIDDPSNYDLKFERVRVRKGLAGELHNLDAQAEAAQEFVDRATRANKDWCKKHLQIDTLGYLTLPRAALSKLDCNDFDLVILRLIDLCGRSKRKVERAERLHLQNWLREPETGRRTLGGALFAKRGEVLVVGREPGRISKFPEVIGASGMLTWDGRFYIKGPIGAQVVPLRDIKNVARSKDIPAFVQAGLPVVVQNDQIWSIPHLGIGNDVFVKFLSH